MHRSISYFSSMIIDFIPDGAYDAPLIRLAHGSRLDHNNFITVIRNIIKEDNEINILHIAGFSKGDNLNSLSFKLDASDKGIEDLGDGNFLCSFSKEHFLDIIDKLENYIKSNTGFYWLNDSSDIELLLSYSGRW